MFTTLRIRVSRLAIALAAASLLPGIACNQPKTNAPKVNVVPAARAVVPKAANPTESVPLEWFQKEPHFRFTFKDGKVLMAKSFREWERRPLLGFMHFPRSVSSSVEIYAGNDTERTFHRGLFIFHIPIIQLKAIRTLPKRDSDPRNFVELELRDGSFVSGELGGSGWSGRTRVKFSNGLEQEVSLRQESIKSATVNLRDPNGVELIVEESNGSKSTVIGPRFEIASINPLDKEATSHEIRVGADKDRLILVPINRLRRISFTGDAEDNAIIELRDEKPLTAPLYSWLYAAGTLLYGENHKIDAELLFESSDISTLKEIVFSEPGDFIPTANAGLSWKWPAKAGNATVRSTPVTQPVTPIPPAKPSKKVAESTDGPPASVKPDEAPPSAASKAARSREKQADSKLTLAKMLLNSNTTAAKRRLAEIVKDFDGTAAAREAKEILREE